MNNIIRLGINGCFGRMGTAIASLALQQPKVFSLNAVYDYSRHKNIGKNYLDQKDLIVKPSSLITNNESIDLLIDFSLANGTSQLVRKITSPKFALLIGSTNLSSNCLSNIKALSKKAVIMVSPNMSIGINLMAQSLSQICSKLSLKLSHNLRSKGEVGLNDTFDISLHEIHHAQKIDSPSGTAKYLLSYLNQNPKKNLKKKDAISISSERVADVAGVHRVDFYLGGEKLTIKHEATSRTIFAKGSLMVGKWLVAQKKGLYTMEDYFK